jgi:predicted metal-binding protein
MTTWITTCDTCKREGWDAGDMAQTDGEALAALIEAAAAGQSAVKTRRVSCLMGCKGACNVVIQGPGKLNYTLGAFEPDAESAEGIVAYAVAHAESETGRVPFREWPLAIKGHFVTRHPPLPSDE